MQAMLHVLELFLEWSGGNLESVSRKMHMGLDLEPAFGNGVGGLELAGFTSLACLELESDR